MSTLLNMDGTAESPTTVIGDTDTERFMTDVIEGSKETPVVVDFWAPWCGPCKQLGPALEKVVKEYAGRVKLMKINVDENQELAAQMRVQSIPMVVAFQDGRPVDGFSGALPESQIRQFVERLTGGGGSAIDQALEEAKALLDEGDAQSASAIYQQVIQHDNKSAQAHAGLVRCLIAADQADEARAYIDGLQEPLRSSPEITAALSALDLQAQAGAVDTGEMETLRKKIEADPTDHQARYDLAIALYGQRKNEEAVDHLIEIVRRKRDWNDEAARMQLLKIFEALGHSHEVTVAGRRKLSTVLFS